MASESDSNTEIVEYIPTKILEHLFLGCQEDAENHDKLLELGIGTIIQVGSGNREFESDFKYHSIDIIDSPLQNLRQHFEDVFQLIEQTRSLETTEQTKTLVHCRMGRSRSATIVIAYLMKSQGWTLKDSYDYVLKVRPQVFTKFIEQLYNYEIELYGKASIELQIIDSWGGENSKATTPSEEPQKDEPRPESKSRCTIV